MIVKSMSDAMWYEFLIMIPAVFFAALSMAWGVTAIIILPTVSLRSFKHIIFIDKQLDKLTQKTLNIPVNKSIKKTLGVNSTKSLIHNADEILKEGSVSELGKRIANTAKWVKHAESAGNVAVGLSGHKWCI
ncbi:hypothetical protein ACU5DF_06820 [Aliivibrio wodanis]|uniref:hypothetical protein n=1 Tax=Aliivibrio wodanis TaxID=80852 RepID=UPI00406C8B94